MKKNLNLKKLLSEDLREYQELSGVGEHYGAAARLAEIFACLPFLKPTEKAEWGQIIQRTKLSADALPAIKRGLRMDVNRLVKILSVGDTWNDDEFLLIILTRSEIDLMVNYINEVTGNSLAVDTNHLDKLFEDSLLLKRSQRAYRRAVGQMQTNRPLPFENKWQKLLD